MTPDFGLLARLVSGQVIVDPDLCRTAGAKQLAAGALPVAMAVVRCENTTDIQRSLAFAAQHALPLAARSGGHCFGDFSNTPGILLDLSILNSVELQRDTVRLGPAALAGDTALALAERGLCLPTGGCPRVALGGLALVGGFGLQARRLGLLCDQVRAIELVEPGGAFRRVDDTSDPELLWALCGAGNGGFGVVTALEMRVHPLPRLRVFHAAWPLSRATEIIALWQSFAPSAENALSLELMLVGPDLPEEPPLVELFGCAQIDSDSSQVADSEVRLRATLGGLASELTCFNLAGEDSARYLCGLLNRRGQSAWMPSLPYGPPGYQCTRSDFHTKPLQDADTLALVEHFGADRRYAEHRELEFVPWGGAMAHANPNSCFAHRSSTLLLRHTGVVGARSSPEMRTTVDAWTHASRACVRSCPSSGSYAGYAEPRRPRLDALYHGDATARLTALQAALDPMGVMRGRV